MDFRSDFGGHVAKKVCGSVPNRVQRDPISSLKAVWQNLGLMEFNSSISGTKTEQTIARNGLLLPSSVKQTGIADVLSPVCRKLSSCRGVFGFCHWFFSW